MKAKRIRFSVVESSLGRILVAATERGVCRVQIGAAPDELVSALRDAVPSAALERDDAGLAGLGGVLVRLAAGSSPGLEVPLDLAGSPFQLRVWRALRRIPRGETRTYAELARSLGRPRAARAVGGACAANPVALLVPCHRAVPAAGGAGGYRFGAARKRGLLRAEADRVASNPCSRAPAPR